MIPLYKPYFDSQEIEAVSDCIKSGMIAEGQKCKDLEKQICDFTEAKHALVCCNCTIGLYMCLAKLGIGKGDIVIVPNITMIASANSVLLTGALPMFADVDQYMNISAESVENLLKANPEVKAIMPVHLYGQSANMTEIMYLAKKYDKIVIEDAAQGIGVKHNRTHVGTIGKVGVISFYADKTICSSTGEGGVILTNDDLLYEELQYFKNQGRKFSGRSYDHDKIGYNFRMSDVQAVGIAVQLSKFNEIHILKIGIYEDYYNRLSDIVKFIPLARYSNFVPYRINILVDDADSLQVYLESKGIQSKRLFKPMHLQKCFFGQTNEDHSVSEDFYNRGLSLPSYPSLKLEEIEYICKMIREFYEKN